MAEKAGGPEVGPARHQQHQPQLEPHDRGGGPAATDAAHGRHAQGPEDQHIVQGRVQRQRQDSDDHGRARPAQALGALAQHDVGHRPRHAPGDRIQIAAGDSDDLGVHIHQGEQRPGAANDDYGHQGAAQRHPNPMPDDFAALPRAPCANQLRHYGHHGHGQAGREQENRPENGAGQGDAGYVHCAVAPGHGGVQKAHAHNAGLGGHDGSAKAQQSPGFAAKASGFDLRGFFNGLHSNAS